MIFYLFASFLSPWVSVSSNSCATFPMSQPRLSSLVGECARSPECVSEVTTLLLAAITITSVIGWLVYQLWLHPLGRYPGPFFGRITPLYDLYHAYKGDKHILLYRLHQRYGTFVRYSPNQLSINDPTAAKVIYGKEMKDANPPSV